VAGDDKAEAIEKILEDDADARADPPRLIQPAGELEWMLDQSAATLLSEL
jgi:6-phosphogluconolactonase/glucosamine-6-phosphate isomerase/deaminase